jgi:hypothetical protein
LKVREFRRFSVTFRIDPDSMPPRAIGHKTHSAPGQPAFVYHFPDADPIRRGSGEDLHDPDDR